MSYIKEKLSSIGNRTKYTKKYAEKIMNELIIFEHHFDRDYLLSNIEDVQHNLSEDIHELTKLDSIYKKLTIICLLLFIPLLFIMESRPLMFIVLSTINFCVTVYFAIGNNVDH